MSSNYGKVEIDLEIKAPAAKFHQVFTHKPHHVSNITPVNFQSCDLHEGEWGTVGSVIYWNYFHDGKAKVCKQFIEAIDAEKNLITFKVIEGDLLEDYKSFVITLQVTPKGDHGSSVHWTFEYEKLHGDIAVPHSLLQFAADVSKDLDSHLTSTQA